MSGNNRYLAVFDFDGVIYRGHSIFDFIQYQERNNIIPEGTWKNIQDDLNLYKSKKKSYEQAANYMLSIYVKSLLGESYEKVKADCKSYLESNSDKFFSYVKSLFKELNSTHGIYIVSTNYQFITEAVCEVFGLDGHIGSIAEVKNGVFTGRVEQSLAGNKDVINRLFKNYPREKSIAVGDSENDIKMLERVEYPVCLEPNEKLKDYAKQKGWIITDEKNIRNDITKILGM